MKNFNTVMQQCLQFLPKDRFLQIVGQHNGDKWTKHFTAYNQLCVMLYAQATGKDSLRDIELGLQYHENKWHHLGLKNVARSTISDANNRRSYQIFESTFYELLNRLMRFLPSRDLGFPNPLYSLDASVVDLCLSLFDWAKFRKQKGAIKLQTLFNNRTQVPEFLNITTGKVHEMTDTKETWQKWDIPKESIITFDKGYIDWDWFYKLNKAHFYFVTRIKRNANYFIIEELPVTEMGIYSDAVIGLGSADALEDYPENLRLVTYYDKEKNKVYQFLTNNFALSAKTIADIYKERWQIELFFKWIKQNLKIKTFLGTSKNAVLSQIWIAMIYYLILAYIKAQTNSKRSMLELSRVFAEAFLDRVSLVDLLFLRPKRLRSAINDNSPPSLF